MKLKDFIPILNKLFIKNSDKFPVVHLQTKEGFTELILTVLIKDGPKSMCIHSHTDVVPCGMCDEGYFTPSEEYTINMLLNNILNPNKDLDIRKFLEDAKPQNELYMRDIMNRYDIKVNDAIYHVESTNVKDEDGMINYYTKPVGGLRFYPICIRGDGTLEDYIKKLNAS